MRNRVALSHRLYRPAAIPAYLALGYANSAKIGSKGWVLPLPATYVLDSTGLIVLSYLDTDHTTRLEPIEIIAALSHLRAAIIPGRNNR